MHFKVLFWSLNGQSFFLTPLFILINSGFFSSKQHTGDHCHHHDKPYHYNLNTDKVCKSLRIQVLIDTCAMRHYNYRRTLDTTLYPSNGMQRYGKGCLALSIRNLF